MGNQTSHRYGRYSNRRVPSIARLQGYVAGQEPDVTSLGLPFVACHLIFIHLSLKDLGSCMRVCKEWRSYIDTCSFWREYLQRYYAFELRNVPKWSALHEWKHRTSCLKVSVTSSTRQNPAAPAPYVFRPSLDMWRCGIAVPYGLAPPDGNLHICHNFLQAMQWLYRLRLKIKELKVRRKLRIEPCLMPWGKLRMPTPKEVLDTFNAHIEIIRSVYDAKTLNRQELRSYYGILRGRYRGPAFSHDLFTWFVDNTGNENLIFDCNADVVDPTPSFLLSHVSQGWVGGVIYAI